MVSNFENRVRTGSNRTVVIMISTICSQCHHRNFKILLTYLIATQALVDVMEKLYSPAGVTYSFGTQRKGTCYVEEQTTTSRRL